MFKSLIILILVLFIAQSFTFAQEAPPAENPIPLGSVEDMFQRINTYRERRGLHPYRLHPQLNTAAQDQAQWLVETGIRTHFRPDGSTPRTRVFATGYSTNQWCCGENYYMSIDATPDMVFNFWIWSPSHFINMTNRNFEEIGIGMAKRGMRISYVLVFAEPSEAEAPPETPTPETVVTAPEVPAPQVQAGDGVHIVQRGETLARIASRYGVSVRDLAAVNNLSDINIIHPGLRLTLPVNTAESAPPPQEVTNAEGQRIHTVQRGETLGRIARQYGVSYRRIAEDNNISNPSLIFPGQVLRIP